MGVASSSIPVPVSTPSAAKNNEVPVPKNPSVVPAMPIKYQYYQSEDCLNISVLAKGLLAEEVRGRERVFCTLTEGEKERRYFRSLIAHILCKIEMLQFISSIIIPVLISLYFD
jgi:hypothetical protein